VCKNVKCWTLFTRRYYFCRQQKHMHVSTNITSILCDKKLLLIKEKCVRRLADSLQVNRMYCWRSLRSLVLFRVIGVMWISTPSTRYKTIRITPTNTICTTVISLTDNITTLRDVVFCSKVSLHRSFASEALTLALHERSEVTDVF